MKTKFITFSLIALSGIMNAYAQPAIEIPSLGSNWSVGLDGGAASPLKGHSFFRDMRGVAGLHVQKQLTPGFALGVESLFGFNTSTWSPIESSTIVDNSYVGAYGAVNLLNLFCGFDCDAPRRFNIEALAGAGWGHNYYNVSAAPDHNFFATNAGLKFSYNVSDNVSLNLKPAVFWNMSDVNVPKTSAAYDIHNAAFSLTAGVAYRFGNGFRCAGNVSSVDVDGLNAQINRLRGELEGANGTIKEGNAKIADLVSELNALRNKKPETIKETTGTPTLNIIRNIDYKIGSSVVTPEQMRNIEMIASYLKEHAKAKVMVVGYASQDGNINRNLNLASERAETIKNILVEQYGIAPERINAQGNGISTMFADDSLNRVSICTIEE